MSAVEEKKAEFLELYDKYIKREGSEKLREYLVSKSDFFTAPASAKFHLSYEGGLCEHSINVFNRLKGLIKAEYGEDFENKIDMESIAICALLHDLCKINCYKVDYRNVKVGEEWTKQPYYSWNEDLVYGHGEKSVYIISSFIHLDRDEALAINWHMGGFDTRVRGGDFGISKVYNAYPLAALLHSADFLATYMDESL